VGCRLDRGRKAPEGGKLDLAERVVVFDTGTGYKYVE